MFPNDIAMSGGGDGNEGLASSRFLRDDRLPSTGLNTIEHNEFRYWFSTLGRSICLGEEAKRMGISRKRVWPGILGLAAGLMLPCAASTGLAADESSHHGNVGEASAEKVIYREGGSILHGRMMEEIKRQQEYIGQKGAYAAGSNNHMLQQGVLLVAEDSSKVTVGSGQGARRMHR